MEKLSEIPLSVDFSALQERNRDVAAWLYCPDTVINYPVVHTNDNETYLRKDLDRAYSKEGTLFIDKDNSGVFSDVNLLRKKHW